MKTLHERMVEDHKIEVPWKVWTKMGEDFKYMEVFGSNAYLSTSADSGTLDELRVAVEFYVEQLGGEVKWGNK